MIRLHHVPQSRSMRVLWLLHELRARVDVAFEVQVWPFDKSLRSPEFLALNPAGRVPALEWDGAVLFETGAIMELLCEGFPAAGLGRVPGEAERSNYLIWLHFAETISQHAAALTQQHIALYPPEVRSAIVMKLEARRLGKCFDALEARLGRGPYLAGGGFSAADVACGQAVYMGKRFARLDGRPALEDWWARITARPAFAAACPEPGAPLLYAQDFYEAPQ